WAAALAFFRDSMIVVGPLLLPIAITLHTFGNEETATVTVADTEETSISTLVISHQDMAVQTPHKCPKCGKSFASAGGLGLHMRRCRAGVQMPLPANQEIRIEVPSDHSQGS
ncbi:MAG TPA: C2H2-type zinc finger protein, partial [Terriglobales bacterium]|nr:C2H2-type zinc finger protein [Terriglobales bacterium]